MQFQPERLITADRCIPLHNIERFYPNRRNFFVKITVSANAQFPLRETLRHNAAIVRESRYSVDTCLNCLRLRAFIDQDAAKWWENVSVTTMKIELQTSCDVKRCSSIHLWRQAFDDDDEDVVSGRDVMSSMSSSRFLFCASNPVLWFDQDTSNKIYKIEFRIACHSDLVL